jgi:hypothetical protein
LKPSFAALLGEAEKSGWPRRQIAYAIMDGGARSRIGTGIILGVMLILKHGNRRALFEHEAMRLADPPRRAEPNTLIPIKSAWECWSCARRPIG